MLSEDVCRRIRVWAFVDRVPLVEIAAHLGVSLRAVRGALVIPGGRGSSEPSPSAATSDCRPRAA